ncbi:MAG: hypothetical protein K2X82_25705 [Gemmataceae bacterium]|nr:hypothetical protein [Gemmataceae bacterium]
MNYAVLIRPRAQAALLGYLLRAADRPALLAVGRDIDARLGRDPRGEGESRDGDTRVAFVRPFSVIYHVDEPNRTVTVEAVGWAGW